MDERDVLAVDVSVFFPASDGARIENLQNKLRRLITHIKKYLSSVEANPEMFSRDEFEQNVKEVSSAEELYMSICRMSTQRQFDIINVEMSMNELCVQISDCVTRLEYIDQRMIENKKMMQLVKGKNAAVSVELEDVTKQIDTHQSLVDQLTSYNNAFDGTGESMLTVYRKSIDRMEIMIREMVTNTEEVSVSVDSLDAQRRTVQQRTEEMEKVVQRRKQKNEDSIIEMETDKDELNANMTRVLRKLQNEEATMQTVRAFQDRVYSDTEMSGKKLDVLEAQITSVYEQQHRAKLDFASLERQIAEIQRLTIETRGQAADRREQSSERSEKIETELHDLQNAERSLSTELSSIKRRLASQKGSKAEAKRTIDGLYELNAVRSRTLESIDAAEFIDSEYEELSKTEITFDGFDEVDSLEQRSGLSCGSITEAAEEERREANRIKQMIAELSANNENVSQKIKEVRARCQKALKINTQLYNPEDPKPLGKKMTQDIVLDVNNRNKARIEKVQKLRGVVDGLQAKVDRLTLDFDSKRDALTTKHRSLMEHELRAEMEIGFSLSDDQRYALKSVMALSTAIRNEMKYWRSAERYQAVALMNSWRICLETSQKDLRGHIWSFSK